MKIRSDFVTNSSSSSFIIAFSKKPESAEDVKKELFGDREWYRHPYDDIVYSSDQVAETVFNDIKNQETSNLNSIVDAIECGWFSGRIEWDDARFKLPNGKFDWDAYDKANREIAENMAKKFIEENENMIVYVVEYGDEDGNYYSALEHGSLFNNVPHIKISCH